MSKGDRLVQAHHTSTIRAQFVDGFLASRFVESMRVKKDRLNRFSSVSHRTLEPIELYFLFPLIIFLFHFEMLLLAQKVLGPTLTLERLSVVLVRVVITAQ